LAPSTTVFGANIFWYLPTIQHDTQTPPHAFFVKLA